MPTDYVGLVNLETLDISKLTPDVVDSQTIHHRFPDFGIIVVVCVGFNAGITGTVPQSFTNLQRLRDVYVQGTSIGGNLDILFCREGINDVEANCLAQAVICSCCSLCCDDTGSNCRYD